MRGKPTWSTRGPRKDLPPQPERVKSVWERLNGESINAYYAFSVYRDLGHKRTIVQAAKALGKTGMTIMYEWSSRFRWVERAEAFDEHMNLIRVESMEKAVGEDAAEMVRRHSGISRVFQQRVLEAMQDLDVKTLTPRDLVQWLDTAVRIERLSVGVPTERVHTSGGAEVDLNDDALDDPETARLVFDLTNRLAGGASDAGRLRLVRKPEEVEDGAAS